MSSTIVYTTKAVCLHHQISTDILVDMVFWGVASPFGYRSESWLFSQKDYDRVGLASRINKDHEISISAVAMALQLLEELDKVRRELKPKYN